MNKEEALKKITDGEGDFQVFTENEHKKFLENLKDTEVFKQQIDVRITDLQNKYDDDLYSILGKRRGESERTYDFMKREYKSLVDNVAEMTQKNIDLQKAVDDKSGSQALDLLKGENESLIKKHQKANEDWKSKYDVLEQSGVQMRIQNEFDRSMTGMKFKDAAIIPEDVRNAMINNAKTELSKTASFVDGKMVFLDSEGKILRDDNLNVLTPKTVLEDKLKSIIDIGRKIEGIKIEDGKPEVDKDGNPIINISLPDSVKTNVDLTDHLLKLGMKSGTKEYMAAYKKYRDKLKILT